MFLKASSLVFLSFSLSLSFSFSLSLSLLAVVTTDESFLGVRSEM
jgi:hypothetical protein